MGTTQNCATATLVVGPLPQEVSQFEILTTTTLPSRAISLSQFEVLATTTLPPWGVSISQVEILATTALPTQGIFTHITLFYGHHSELCNWPIKSWPIATGGTSVWDIGSEYNYVASMRRFQFEILATTMLPPCGVSIYLTLRYWLHEVFPYISVWDIGYNGVTTTRCIHSYQTVSWAPLGIVQLLHFFVCAPIRSGQEPCCLITPLRSV